MPTDVTKVLDVITPEIFNKYMTQYSHDHNALIRSGVAVADETVSRMITEGGMLVNMPFWNDLSGDDEVLDDSSEIGTDKVTSGADIAHVLYRAKGWSYHELAGIIAGDDPGRVILERFGEYWTRREQAILLAILKGIFANGGALASTHLLDISARSGQDSIITAEQVLDARQLLGDRSNQLRMIAMHSAVMTKLKKDDLIEFIKPSEGGKAIPYYMGMQVLEDDTIKPDGDVYTTYMLAQGSFGRNTGTPATLTTFETERQAAKSTNNVYTRRAIVLHPYGVSSKYVSTGNGKTPTNAELATAANWMKVYTENKNIGIVALKHKVGSAGA